MFEPQGSPASRPEHLHPCTLSDRELAALRGVADGKGSEAIAAERSVADSTVRSQLSSAYQKLDVNDRTQAVLVATARGWL